MHTEARSALQRSGGRRSPAGRPLLVAVAAGPREAGQALAAGADAVDVTGGPAAATAVRERYPGARLWAGTPGPVVDADLLAAGGPAGDDGEPQVSAAAVVAVAAISTWLGAAAIRTRHTRPARRAIDMTCAIAGTRPPALTTRGLA